MCYLILSCCLLGGRAWLISIWSSWVSHIDMTFSKLIGPPWVLAGFCSGKQSSGKTLVEIDQMDWLGTMLLRQTIGQGWYINHSCLPPNPTHPITPATLTDYIPTSQAALSRIRLKVDNGEDALLFVFVLPHLALIGIGPVSSITHIAQEFNNPCQNMLYMCKPCPYEWWPVTSMSSPWFPHIRFIKY